MSGAPSFPGERGVILITALTRDISRGNIVANKARPLEGGGR
jgi:hypothetical protein